MGAGAGRIVARTTWRLHSRALVVVALLLALAGGTVLAGVAAARRGDSAPARLDEAFHPPGVTIFTFPDQAGPARVELLEALLDDAGIDDYEIGVDAALLTVAEAPAITPIMLAAVEVTGGPFRNPILVDGRLPTAIDEIAVNESSTERFGVGIGGTIHVSWYHVDDLQAIGGGDLTIEPAASTTMRITGVVRFPADLTEDARAEPGTLFVGNAQYGLLTSSFWERFGDDIAAYQVAATLDATPEQFDALLAASEGLPVFVQRGEGSDDDYQRGVRNAVHLESVALLAFAGVLGLGLVVFLGVAVARTAAAQGAEQRTIVALGVEGRDLVAGAALVGATVGAAGSAGALVVAVILSNWAPIGFAARAEIDPGVDVDLSVLAPGTASLLVVAVTAAVLGARRAAADAGQRVGAPLKAPPLVSLPTGVGAQLFAASARGRDAGGVRAGLGLAVLGVVAVVAAGSFAVTLAGLTSSQEEQGWNWDLAVGNYADAASPVAGAEVLAADPDVEAFAGFNSDVVVIDGHELVGAGFEPGIDPVVLEGRSPSAPDEVAVGRASLRLLGKSIGDDVAITDTQTGDLRSFRIVGVVVPPAPLGDGMTLDEGATFTFEGFTDAAFGGTEGILGPYVHLVRLRAGADVAVVRDRLAESFPATVNTRAVTSDIRSLQRVQRLPYGLALALGALGLGATILVLDALTRRRRRDLALLRSVGFTRRQLVLVVLSQATILSVGAVGLGVPLGLAAGSRLWAVAADRIGTDLPSIIPVGQILVAVPAVVVAVVGLAALPAIAAARRPPVLDLRPD